MDPWLQPHKTTCHFLNVPLSFLSPSYHAFSMQCPITLPPPPPTFLPFKAHLKQHLLYEAFPESLPNTTTFWLHFPCNTTCWLALQYLSSWDYKLLEGKCYAIFVSLPGVLHWKHSITDQTTSSPVNTRAVSHVVRGQSKRTCPLTIS